MIVIWKKDGPLLHRAEWMNMLLVLAWERDAWRCRVNGDRTKQRWDSVEAAKIGVDAVVLKLLSNGPVVPVGPGRPKLTMQGLVSVMASIAVVERYEASKVEAVLPRLRTFMSQGSRSGRVPGGVSGFMEVEHAR